MATRIQRSSKPLPAPTKAAAARAAGASPSMGTLDQIKELIPGEAAALYIAGLGVIPGKQLIVIIIWALLGLVVTVLVKAQQKDAQQQPVPTEWNQVVIAAGAFVIWVYALGGGPFEALGWYLPWLATLLILAYTALSPWILTGLDKVLSK